MSDNNLIKIIHSHTVLVDNLVKEFTHLMEAMYYHPDSTSAQRDIITKGSSKVLEIIKRHNEQTGV